METELAFELGPSIAPQDGACARASVCQTCVEATAPQANMLINRYPDQSDRIISLATRRVCVHIVAGRCSLCLTILIFRPALLFWFTASGNTLPALSRAAPASAISHPLQECFFVRSCHLTEIATSTSNPGACCRCSAAVAKPLVCFVLPRDDIIRSFSRENAD